MWTKNRFTQMLQSQFAKDTAVLTLGTTAAQLLGIATMPVLARLYSPADFGVLAVFLAVSGIVAITITLRYEMHILLPKEENEAATLVFICLSSTLFLGVLLATMGWLLCGKIQRNHRRFHIR